MLLPTGAAALGGGADAPGADAATGARGGPPRGGPPPNLVPTEPRTPRQGLFGAADGLVQPSRGEGWGLPLAEAMAVGTVVVGTRWSGPAAFLTDDNSLPLRTDGLATHDGAEEAAADPADGTVRPHQWAAPSIPHLRLRLRQLAELPAAERARLGAAARADMAGQFSGGAVAELTVQRLQGLLERTEARPTRARRHRHRRLAAYWRTACRRRRRSGWPGGWQRPVHGID